MSKIYTGKGDHGTTELLGGRVVSKTDPQVEAYGTVDELTAAIGLATTLAPPTLADKFVWVQEQLFVIGAILAQGDLNSKEGMRLEEGSITLLEKWIDELVTDLPPQTKFLLPGPKGGSQAASQIHVARAICRRAERRVWALAGDLSAILVFLNRLSDYLYAAARWLNFRLGVEEYEIHITKLAAQGTSDGE